MSSNSHEDAISLRQWMVDTQLAARGIHDRRVLDAMRHVPRHLFCPPETALEDAYGDFPLPIGHGQTISQPWIVAAMAEALALRGTERVLEIGTGSGYGAAILALLSAEMHTVELIPELAIRARNALAQVSAIPMASPTLRWAALTVHAGDGSEGLPTWAPYDAICVTAAAPMVPAPLVQQLAAGGRIVIPVGSRESQELLVLCRQGQELIRHHYCGCRFVPLLGTHGFKRL